MTDEELEKASAKILTRLDAINSRFIQMVATQIRKIGTIAQSGINRLVAMSEMAANVAKINNDLSVATALNQHDIQQIYTQVLNNTYTDKRFIRFVQAGQVPDEAKTRLKNYTRSVIEQTNGTLQNLSNTTLVSQAYQNAIDDAILATSTGQEGYKAATRETVMRLGRGGMQVGYPSGYHRRLDSAVRQNIVDGANQLAQNCSMEMGRVLKYDAIEISAHARSAPDHEPIQGHVFTRAQFEMLQAGGDVVDIDGNRFPGIRRPIGEWNCMHIAMPFSTKTSIRTFTDAQLRDFIAKNHAGAVIGGKTYTIYQCVQKMREIETEVRLQKDIAVAAQAAGDDELRRQCQIVINRLNQRYLVIAQAAKITPRKDRMSVEGFRMYKIK